MSVRRSRSRGIGRPAGAAPLSLLTAVSATSPTARSSVTSDTDRRLPVHVVDRWADVFGDLVQRRHVDAVERGGVETQDLACLVLGHGAKPLGDPVAGVRIRALRMREVVAPQQVLDADLVPTLDLVDARGGGGEGAVAVDVLAGLHGQAVLEDVAELAGVVSADPLLVHAFDEVGHPPGPVLGDGVAEGGVTLEYTREDEHPERPCRPPPRLRGVDRDEAG